MKILRDMAIMRVSRRLIKEKAILESEYLDRLKRQKELYEEKEKILLSEIGDLNEKIINDRAVALDEKEKALAQKEKAVRKELNREIRAEQAIVTLITGKNNELLHQHKQYRDLRGRNEKVAETLSGLTQKLQVRIKELGIDVTRIFQDAQSQLDECDMIEHLDSKRSA